MKQVLKDLDKNQKLLKDQQIFSQLVKLLQYTSPQSLNSQSVIGLYHPIDQEPGLLNLWKDTAMALPILKPDQTMGYKLWKGETLKGPWHDSTSDWLRPEVLIVPGLAFSKRGFRLGRGKGFYDRYLEVEKPSLSIGVCYELQMQSEWQSEKHDRPLDFIITEKVCWDVSQQTVLR